MTRTDWTDAAFGMFTAQGIAAVSVEALAKQLGATRGSFYWHFKDRADLITAVLEKWRAMTFDVVQELYEIADPNQRLRALLSMSFEDETWARRELDLLANTSDPHIGQAVERHTGERLDFIQHCLTEIGHPNRQAHIQARQSWALWIGAARLVASMPDLIPGETTRDKLLSLTQPILATMLEQRHS